MGSVKYHLLFCLTLLAPLGLFCQKTYQFRLIDRVSKQPVPFATVGLVQQNTGASTDSEGMLSLKGVVNSADSVIVSCLGYESKRLALAQLSVQDINSIELESKVYTMQAIEIKPEEFSDEVLVLNKIIKKDYPIGLIVGDFSQQNARKFELKPEQGRNLLRSLSFLAKRRPDHQIATIRVRIYEANPDSEIPGPDLLNTNIIRTVHKNDEIIKVDLSKYGIIVSDPGFFVAFEWIKTKENSIQLRQRDGSFRESFIPSIGITGEKSDSCWTLNYKNEWSDQFKFDLAISAEISPAIKKN